MFILSVIPIQRGIPFSTLSYYSTDALSAGTLVELPLGKQVIHGLVVEATSLIEAKTSIKQATFSLKKIKSVVGISAFSTALIEGLREASAKTVTPIGSLASLVMNELFFDLLQKLPTETIKKDVDEKIQSVVYGITLERVDQYKRIIRSAFAQRKSVVLVAPSIRALEYWHATLQKGISTHTLLLHSKVTKRDQKTVLSTIKQSERPLFICTTPLYAVIPRDDISTIIIEDEASSLYKTNDRFETDMRVVLDCIGRALRISIVYGDTLPRFETLHHSSSIELPRSYSPEKLVVVEIDPYRSILPTETVELIRYCQKNKTLFIYTNRKGLAPLSRCADCGTTVDCPTCGLPIVLRHKIVDGERQRLFICKHCGDTLPPTHVCSYCASWNITPVSIGTESIREAVVSIIPETQVVSIDDDLTPDSKSIDTLLSDIQKKKWFVLIGTQKLLPYIKAVDFVVIPFFDRLLSVPSPVVVEETLRLIMECNEKTKDSLILCTKKPDFPITKLLSTKKIQEIIDTDMETREALHYPPFGALLKLSITVPSAQREMVTARVESFFEGVDITALPVRRISPESMKLLCVWIISGPSSYTQENSEELQAFLQELRFPYSLQINPSRL